VLFTELRFLVFFGLVLGVHWALRGDRARKVFLLAASYLFYAGWDWRFLGLILLSTAVDWVAARGMGRSADEAARRRWLGLSLVVNLGVLGLFKYWDFFVESAAALLAWLGLETSPRTLSLILPVGISFYTFQTLSYSIDVYRRRLEPADSGLDFALFVAFFPQLVAGPIVRASEFLPQLRSPRRLGDVPVRSCLTLFLVGYVKKACLADNLAASVDPVFADPGAMSGGALWLALALYAVQIYCDFSGYSDMAIAAGGLLGLALPLNFDRPYLAASVTDFWRRWHISLSTWFRDYLYLPLGGNRGSRARTHANLAVVFLLCGLWHGASWNFVVWGLLHGTFLVVERWTGLRTARRFAGARWAVTTMAVVLAWIPFRCASLADSGLYVAGLLGAGGPSAPLPPWAWLLVLLPLAAQWWLARTCGVERFAAMPRIRFAFAYGVAVALALPWVAADYQPFIYFQF
jgi:alginate O-acetyltransferase complex protein AlgI